MNYEYKNTHEEKIQRARQEEKSEGSQKYKKESPIETLMLRLLEKLNKLEACQKENRADMWQGLPYRS